MTMIKSNAEQIVTRIHQSCDKVSRDVQEVCPIIVTKNRTNEEIQEVYSLGFRHFAENRVEKLLDRQNAFPQKDIVWHLIGPLQKRKVKQIVNQIQYFHAIDRLSIMEEIDKRLDSPLKCFLEVNVSGEESKHGFTISEVFEAYEVAKQYPNIEIIGLMTMAPFEANDEAIRNYFRELKEVSKKLQSESTLKLSMGMSQDYPIAIEEGAHFIRIGTAWFE
ncbi:MAG: YggS family pyridoxal phosphate-dependent enzyme [Granulicatella sp.]|nr:YggS family pyridoxal phosphate-dependent enzyme [Granulicatella sp.]